MAKKSRKSELRKKASGVQRFAEGVIRFRWVIILAVVLGIGLGLTNLSDLLSGWIGFGEFIGIQLANLKFDSWVQAKLGNDYWGPTFGVASALFYLTFSVWKGQKWIVIFLFPICLGLVASIAVASVELQEIILPVLLGVGVLFFLLVMVAKKSFLLIPFPIYLQLLLTSIFMNRIWFEGTVKYDAILLWSLALSVSLCDSLMIHFGSSS